MEGVAEILLVALCFRNWDKLHTDRPPGLCADLTYHQTGEVSSEKKCNVLITDGSTN